MKLGKSLFPTWCKRQAELLEGGVHSWDVMTGKGLRAQRKPETLRWCSHSKSAPLTWPRRMTSGLGDSDIVARLAGRSRERVVWPDLPTAQ